MFRWTQNDRRQKLEIKCQPYSQARTELQSYTQSPAHSNYSINSLTQTTHKKLKFVTPQRSKGKTAFGSHCQASIGSSITKSELIKLLNSKNKQGIKRKIEVVSLFEYEDSKNLKKQIKIKISVNKMIGEYNRAGQQFLGKPWGIFVAASILKTMGFIEDLVKQRSFLKNLWSELKQPDPLNLYVFLEQLMNNRVQIESALNLISIHFKIHQEKLNKNSAIQIITQKRGSQFYHQLQKNRISRQSFSTHSTQSNFQV